MAPANAFATPVREVGSFLALSLDKFVQMFSPRFACREFLDQARFVPRVSLFPTVLLTVPFRVSAGYLVNVSLIVLGAADFSGIGASKVSNTGCTAWVPGTCGSRRRFEVSIANMHEMLHRRCGHELGAVTGGFIAAF